MRLECVGKQHCVKNFNILFDLILRAEIIRQKILEIVVISHSFLYAKKILLRNFKFYSDFS